MGIYREPIPVLWDTGSAWLAIEGYLCSTCTNKYKYDYSAETGLSFTRKTNGESTINYGSVDTTGFYATDTVCLTNSSTTCTKNFNIYIMSTQSGMPSNVAAISGLATDSLGNGPNLIKSMKSSGVISNSYFCFYLEGMSTTSYLDIGIIDNTAMKDSKNLNMIPILSNNYWWSANVEGIRFGTSESDAWGLDATMGILDSGTSCLSVPNKYYDWLLTQLRGKGLNYQRD